MIRGATFCSALLYGSRISLSVGLTSVVLSLLLGVSLGLWSGFAGGWLDNFIMRVCDVMLSFPSILVALLISGVGRAFLGSEHASFSFVVHCHFDHSDWLGSVRPDSAWSDFGRT